MTAAEPAGPASVRTPWPLVGRHNELGVVSGALSRGAVVAVVGGAGAGKSRLISEACERAVEHGFAVARVVATRSASAIPFGALTPLLPVEDLLVDTPAGLLRRAAKSIADRGAGKPVVLIIDDAHVLDDASSRLVHQLALERAVRLVLAVRSGEPVPPSLAAVLGDSSSTTTVEVRSLSREETDDLAEIALGGPVDGITRQTLWDRSGGNPLYLRELIAGAVDGGVLVREAGIWRLSRTPLVSPRLVDLVERRLGALDDDQRRAMELLAEAGTLGLPSLLDLCGDDVVRDLAAAGLITIDDDGARRPVRLHHPLHEEVLRTLTSPRRARAAKATLADLLASHGARRRGDLLRLTTLHLDIGRPVDLDVLERAADDAYFVLDSQLCERIARAGIAAGGGARLRRLLAELLRWQGRYEESETILAGIELDSLDDRQRALTVVTRAENLFRGLARRDEADLLLLREEAKVADPAWRDEIVALRAINATLAGDVTEATQLAEPIVQQQQHGRAFTTAVTALAGAYTYGGRAEDAAELAARGFSASMELGPQEGLAAAPIHMVERCFALVALGDVQEALGVAHVAYEWSLAGHHLLGQSWFAALLGNAHLVAGNLGQAMRWLNESAVTFLELREHGVRRWSLGGLAQAAAGLGRPDEAAVALDQLDQAPRTELMLLEPEVIKGRAWLAIARGERSHGRELLVDAADWARQRSLLGLELGALHDLVRIGDLRFADRTVELGSVVQGNLAGLRGAHAAAVVARDVEQLLDVSTGFERIGCSLFAAEAAAQAATLHRRDGRAAGGQAAADRASVLAAACDDPRTPALADLEQAPVELTPREHEIALLAAAGDSSRSIAERLGISTRTVDNQLQRVYAKLGIGGRRELRGRLASES